MAGECRVELKGREEAPYRASRREPMGSPDSLSYASHRFHLAGFYPYGDNHVFTIKVEDIRPQAGPGKYPRVVEKQGEAPEQYR